MIVLVFKHGGRDVRCDAGVYSTVSLYAIRQNDVKRLVGCGTSNVHGCDNGLIDQGIMCFRRVRWLKVGQGCEGLDGRTDRRLNDVVGRGCWVNS
jgi:hypothetical protein